MNTAQPRLYAASKTALGGNRTPARSETSLRQPVTVRGDALPSYPRLPRVSRLNSTAVTPHYLPVIPAHAGIHTVVVGGTTHRDALRTGVGDSLRPLVLRTKLGLDSSVRWNDGEVRQE